MVELLRLERNIRCTKHGSVQQIVEKRNLAQGQFLGRTTESMAGVLQASTHRVRSRFGPGKFLATVDPHLDIDSEFA